MTVADPVSPTTLLPMSVGFLGVHRSTSSYETFTLIRTDRAPTALLYVVVSLVG
jgi:fluoride ion exporter CrcB/FEX